MTIMSTIITAPEFIGLVDGGSALGGQYVFITLRLGEDDTTFFVEKSRVGLLMLGLATAAGMARKERLLNDPTEARGEGKDAAYALKLKGAKVGLSREPSHAILDVLIDADKGRGMNMYLAADAGALRRLRAACDHALRAIA